MGPTYSSKKGLRYRYYTSRALTEDRKSEAGSIARVSADDVETRVIEAMVAANSLQLSQNEEPNDPRVLIRTMVERVVVAKDRLTITIADDEQNTAGPRSLDIAWTPKPGKPKRDLVLPINNRNPNPRPLHSELRTSLLRAVALGRKWLQDLISGRSKDAETIAAQNGRSTRSVNMMISLAFVAPDIIEAAAAGRLPRGIGITRLIDLPFSWAEQKTALGLSAKF